MPRENSKCRKWEKERRDRLNNAFAQLAKLLPCYDPSINICKIDILQKSVSTIGELQDKIKKILSSDTEKKTETEDIIKKLQERIKKLLVRNEQLSNLLRDARISVPSAYGSIKKFKKKFPWSRKISPEKAELLQKTEMEKENICSNLVHGKKKKTKVNANISTKRRTNIVQGGEQKGILPKKKRSKKNPASNCLIVLSQPSSLRKDFSQQCYLITPQPSNNIHKNIIKTGTTNSGIFSKPLVITSKTKTSKDILENNATVPILNPGTLILANGTIMRILPNQYQTFQPALSNLLINSTIGVVPKNIKGQDKDCSKRCASKNSSQTNIHCSGIRTLPAIRPKYCLTRTTQVNKVPIPALTSRYANNNILLNESNVKQNKEKTMKTARTDEIKNSSKITKKSNKRKIEDQNESNSKRSKINNCTKDPVSDETCISNNYPSTIVTVNSVNENSNEIGLHITNKEETNNGNYIIKETVKINREETVEKSVTQKTAMSENTAIPKTLNNSDNMENLQKTLINNDVSSEETLVASTVVTTNAVIITTTNDVMKNLDLNLSHSELSNDIFASLQVPSGCQNPESTSPTAAFLLAFPLVSSGVKVTEVIEEENSDSQRGTPTLLQIGTMEMTKSTQSHTETTSNFLNLDSFSFIPSKDICSNFYSYPNTVSKSEKVTLPTTLSAINKADPTVNKSIYVNVKSPCLPNCVSESVKENYSIFDLKSVNSAKVGDNVNGDNCEKKGHNEIVNNSIDFNLRNQSSSKTNSNYACSKEQIKKSSDQKSRYYNTPSTYSNSTCNFNYKSEATKLSTNSYVNITRNYTNPLYTNCSNYNYNYHPDTNFNQTYYKNIPGNETKAYYPLNYENYPDYRKNEPSALSGYYEPTYAKDSRNNNVVKAKTNQNKLPINWMTTPDTRLQNSECLLNSFSKGDFSQTYPFSSYVTSTSTSTYFTSTSTDTTNVGCIMEAKKCLELPPAVSLNQARPDAEEKQFSWSPTKLPHFLDHPHNFVTSTLPTLVGDLALGNTLSFGEQKNDYKYFKENKDMKRNNRINSYDTQSNFLSVSQLVDHNKAENIPAKISTRRNSGNRTKNTAQQKVKRGNKHDIKDGGSNCGINSDKICERVTGNFALTNVEVFSEQKNRNASKNASSSYSAEALIGNQVSDEAVHKRYAPPSSKPLGTSGFLAENIISYFPPVDLAQDSFMSQNQNYQTNNFTHNICTTQNNTYPSNNFIYAPSTITSTYLPTNNFEATHDYLPDNLMSTASNKGKHYNIKQPNRQQAIKDDKNNHNTICQNNFKKSKKKQITDTAGALTSFEFPFLSIPGSNNSPILPDDFHSHTNFLPPTTPFSCKNSLYSKQNDLSNNPILPLSSISRSNIQHPEISPSINSVGTSLTNFNLSTIFPEINKGPITEMYPDPRSKEHTHSKSCTSSSPQVPFNTEPKFSFST